MTEFARLVMTADSRGLVSGEEALHRLTRAGAKAEAATDRMSVSTTRAGSVVARAMDSMGGAATRAAVAFAGMAAAGLSVAAFGRMTQKYTELTNSLRVLGLSGDGAAARLEEIGAIAARTRAPLEATAQLYTRISMSAGELGASQQDVLRFTEAVGLALAQQGTSAAAASGALMQLSQAMGGGVVRAEEFNSILEGAHPIALAAARGIDEAGGSVARLRQLVIDGKISSEDFFNAILSQTSALQAAMANAAPTVGGALQVLYDQLTLVVGGFDAAIGASATAASAILLVAGNVERLAFYGAAAAAAFALSMTPAIIAATVAAGRFVLALVATRAALLRTGIGILVVGAGELAYQFSRLVERAGGFGRAMALMGEVAVQVFNKIAGGASFVGNSIAAAAAGMEAVFLAALRSMAGQFVEFTQMIAEGLNSLFGLNLRGASAVVTQELGRAELAARGYAASASEAANAGLEAFNAPITALDALTAATEGAADASNTAAGAATRLGGAAGGASKGVDALAEAAKKWKDRITEGLPAGEKYRQGLAEVAELQRRGALTAAEAAKAQRLLADEFADGVPVIGDVATAFGDFIAGGLRDFKGFVQSILGSFRQMLSTMISEAARRQITFMFGGAGSVAGSAASAATPGAGGGILGKIGLGISNFGTGFGAGLQSFFTGGFGAIGAALKGISTATTLMGGLGTALGALAAPLAIVGFLFSAFRTKTTLLDSGLRVTVNNMEAMVETFRKIEKSRFFGLFKSTSTGYQDAPAAVADPIERAVRDMQRNILDAAGVLGIAEGAFASFVGQITVSTKGLSEDDAVRAVQEALAGLGDKFALMIPGLAALQKEGESATDAVARLSGALTAANLMADTLGLRFRAVGLAGADMASKLADAFGGLDALQSATAAYYAKFYSEEERRAVALRQTTGALAKLNLAMPATRDEYRAMVTGMDLTTEAGRNAFAALVGLSDAFDFVLPKVASFTQAMQDMASGIVTMVDGLIARTADAQRTAEQTARDWRSTADRVRDYVAGIRGTAGALVSATAARAFNEARYQTTLAGALAGDAAAGQDVTGAADTLLSSVTATASTAFEVARAQARILADMGGLGAVADAEAARHETVAGLLGEQVTLLGTIRDALNSDDLTSAQLAVLRTQVGLLIAERVQAFGPVDPANPRPAALGGLRDALQALLDAMRGTVPGFAAGGLHGGGWRLVGERGPELEATGAARIFSASQTRDLLGGDVATEIRALRQEVTKLREENRQLGMAVAQNTRESAATLRKFDKDGLPSERI